MPASLLPVWRAAAGAGLLGVVSLAGVPGLHASEQGLGAGAPPSPEGPCSGGGGEGGEGQCVEEAAAAGTSAMQVRASKGSVPVPSGPQGSGDVLVSRSPSPEDLFYGRIPPGYLENIGHNASEGDVLDFIRGTTAQARQVLRTQMDFMAETLGKVDDGHEFLMRLSHWDGNQFEIINHFIRIMCVGSSSCGQLFWEQLKMIHTGKFRRDWHVLTMALAWTSAYLADQIETYLHSVPETADIPRACVDPLNRVLIPGTNFNGWHLIHLLGGMELGMWNVNDELYDTAGDIWNFLEGELNENSHQGKWEKALKCQEQPGLQIGYVDLWKAAAADVHYRNMGRKLVRGLHRDATTLDCPDVCLTCCKLTSYWGLYTSGRRFVCILRSADKFRQLASTYSRSCHVANWAMMPRAECQYTAHEKYMRIWTRLDKC